MLSGSGLLLLGIVLRLLTGGLFLIAGFTKLQTQSKIRIASIKTYQVVPPLLLVPMAWLLPTAEVTSSVTILTGALYPLGAVLPGLLLITITAALVYSLLRGVRAPCGCSRRSEPRSWKLVVRNLLFLTMIGVVATLKLDRPGIGSEQVEVQLLVILAISAGLCVTAMRTRSRSSADLMVTKKVHKQPGHVGKTVI